MGCVFELLELTTSIYAIMYINQVPMLPQARRLLESMIYKKEEERRKGSEEDESEL